MKIMDINMLFFVTISYILANCFEARDIFLTKEEDLAIEKQLRIINKAGVTTITTEHGDIYDCVDFYKQPAFDHPQLKNHSFYPQMKYKYQNKKNNISSINVHTFKAFKDGGCPVGSVPIKRITKADLIREKQYPLRFESLDGNQAADVAIVQTQSGYGPFTGAGMIAGIYKPPVSSGPSYSAVRLRIQNGDDAIQVGWRVDPALYGDNKLRFYIYFKAGQKQCFNTRCSGFVYVNSDLPLDHVFEEYNTGEYSKIMHEIVLYLTRDNATGNWWLLLGANFTEVGFWPASIFSGLNSLATYVDWGGEVLDMEGDVQMGLGRMPKCDSFATAFCRAITVLTPDGKTNDAAITQSRMTSYGKYRVLNIDHSDDYYRHTLFYGGPLIQI